MFFFFFAGGVSRLVFLRDVLILNLTRTRCYRNICGPPGGDVAIVIGRKVEEDASQKQTLEHCDHN